MCLFTYFSHGINSSYDPELSFLPIVPVKPLCPRADTNWLDSHRREEQEQTASPCPKNPKRQMPLVPGGAGGGAMVGCPLQLRLSSPPHYGF